MKKRGEFTNLSSFCELRLSSLSVDPRIQFACCKNDLKNRFSWIKHRHSGGIFISMDIADLNRIVQPSTGPCTCYRTATLTGPVLEATQISKLEDQYKLGDQLGWGQFGTIRACLNKLNGEVLACKSIAKERLTTQQDVKSVKLEIEIMTKLSGHPNVVSLKAVYEEENFVHLVMELCAGGELFHRLEKNGRFSEIEARVLFRHLMQVVMYCHDKGIVHRDLKPENILLVTKSSSSPIKLADFGLATYIEPGQSLSVTVGSPFYIAPEVLSGGYNQAADIWSAGVILYILLSGVPPFWGKTKSRIFDAVRAANLCFPPHPWDSISSSAKDLITGMICINPLKRLTAAQVLAHSWIRASQEANEATQNPELHFGNFEVGGISFSTTFLDRNQDYSFNNGKLGNSPAFMCKTSFSSFLADNSAPFSISERLSFSSCRESDGEVGFSSPVTSIPSFTFFSPSSTTEEGNNPLHFKGNNLKSNRVHGDSTSRKLFAWSESSRPIKQEERETDRRIEIRSRTSGLKISGIHSKRNHTIGLGELEQFDLLVTESIIRWASCTHIPTATSLRSSVVC